MSGKRLPWLEALGLAALAAAPGRAWSQDEAPRCDVEADAWYAGASGWIYITRGSQPGSATKAREGHEVGLDPGFLPVGEAWFRFWGQSALGFRIVPAEESGTHTASGDFIYHGMTYAAARQIRSDVGLLLADVDYQYRWELTEDLAVTPHAGMEYWGFSSRLRTVDALPPVDEKRSFSSGYWLLGTDTEFRITEFLRAQACLLGGTTGSSRYFLQADAGLALRLGSGASLSAQYRLHEVRFHTSTNQANLLFQGPSAGLEIRF